MSALASRRTLILFDVDGTLTCPAQKADNDMLLMLDRLRERYTIGIVGAGDFEKQQWQLGGPDLRERLDVVFSENGVHSFRGGTLLHIKSIAAHLGDQLWNKFLVMLEEVLRAESAEAERLFKVASPAEDFASRSTFLEIRQCTVNVCPIGRTPVLSKDQRAAFEVADRASGMRQRVLAELLRRFGPETPFGLNFSIGGQIGIDCAPCGWDKTFCLQFVDAAEFDEIHFFGDKTEPGGGDYELYEHSRVVGHAVRDAADTMEQVTRLFLASV